MITTLEPTVEYESLLRRGARERAAVTIRGVLARKPAQGLFGPKGCTPIMWCFCVHDSPSSPCPCTGPIIWLPDDQIINISHLKRPGPQGEAVVEAQVAADARLFIDETREVAPRQHATGKLLRSDADGKFSRVKETLWVQEYLPIRAATLAGTLDLVGSNPKLQVIAMRKGGGVWSALAGAFKFGWEIGEYIDDKTGISDELADWLYDQLGPWDELF